jgi:hypothetical protein
MEKNNQDKKGGPFGALKFHMALAQLCKNILACLFKHPSTSVVIGRKLLVGCRL